VRGTVTASPPRLQLALAFAAIYVIWGTTFLAAALMLQTLPPFAGAALRFVSAGLLLLLWLRWRDRAWRAGLPLGRVAVCGVLLVSCGNGCIVWAQQGVPSGIAALVIAATPVAILVLQRAFFGHRLPQWQAVLGILIGLAGVALIVSQISTLSGAVRPLHVFSLLAAVFAWALGTLLHGAVPVRLVMASAAVQMLVGGLVLGLMAIPDGDWQRLEPARVSVTSLAAVGYLVVFGSIVAQGCYLWLIGHVAPQKVSTYALVNPVVAMALGALVLGERLNALAAVAVLLVLVGVALVLWPTAGAARR
jgi:drug/metabolite transporter (DMT)-like permease